MVTINSQDINSKPQMFYGGDDDHGDLGDIGGEGDMACDFGGDCGAF